MRPCLALFPFLAFAFSSRPVIAQDYFLSQPTVNACSGTLYDSGGPTADYGNNEAYTTVVCPDQPGASVSLAFIAFNLSTAGDQDDALAIYDGNSTSAPLIGTFTAQLLFNLIITASEQNTSGCLTLVFTSNGTGTGNIQAGISCYVPCAAPTASFTTSLGDTARLCIGDTLFVDGSSSQAATGQVLESWRWSMGYQIPVVSDLPTDTLIMQLPGAYHLRLVVTDSSSCVSDPSESAVIIVSGPPTFTGTTVPSIACVPDEVILIGSATPTTVTLLPDSVAYFGEGIPLPDDVGTPFHSVSHVFSEEPDAVINVASDLGDICIEMEHSFMGDLTIELQCPNGQSVALHQQGGSGTFIGDANDQGPGPGICWTYCFNSDPDHDTWAESGINGIMPSVIQASQGFALAPGSYSSVDPLSNLIGCPVNGNWTLTIVDSWAADNGYLCSWNLGFASESDTIGIDVTPSISLDHADSAFWNGVSVVNLNGSNATAAFPVAGEYAYTFTVVDSYGCAYDTTMSISAWSKPVVEAGPDIELCTNPVLMDGMVTVDPWLFTCAYYLVLHDVSGNGWSGAQVTCSLNGVATNYSMLIGYSDTIPLDVLNGESIVLSYVGSVSNIENRFELFYPPSGVLFTSSFGPTAGIHYDGIVNCDVVSASVASLWSPTTGLVDPTDPQTAITPPASGWYWLIAEYPEGQCSVSDSLWVGSTGETTSLQWNTSSSSLCCDVPDLTTYDWYLHGEFFSTTNTNCLNGPPYGAWTVVGFSDTECAVLSDTIFICPTIEIDHDLGFVFTTDGLGAYAWSFNGSVIPNSDNASIASVGSGNYSVTVVMPGGCEVGASADLILGIAELSFSDLVFAFPNPNTGVLRLMAPFAASMPSSIEILDVAGRTAWTTRTTFSNTGVSDELMLSLSSGTYTVLITTPRGLESGKLMIE